jgi:hypothetical protein
MVCLLWVKKVVYVFGEIQGVTLDVMYLKRILIALNR